MPRLLVMRLTVQMLDVEVTEMKVKVSGKLVQKAFYDDEISDKKLFKSDDVAKCQHDATCLELKIRRCINAPGVAETSESKLKAIIE